MAITQLEYRCPECNSKSDVLGDFISNDVLFYILSCGHFQAVQLDRGTYDGFVSLEGDKPYKFQLESMKFIEDSAGNALIAHEMGLGKTICAAGYLLCNTDKATPAF